MLLRRICILISVFVILLAFWEEFSKYSKGLRFVLPAPSEILAQLWNNSDRFWFHSMATFKIMAGGLVAAIVIAFPFAWLMASWRTAHILLQPLFIITQCLPMFTLAPIMVFWFGWTYTAIVVPTTLMIFFPLTMNLFQGLRSTPQHLLDYFRIHQATAWQTLYKLQLPWALPHLFAGLRISAAIAGIGAIAGEWAGAPSGLGLLMLESRRSADLETVFAALLCILFVSLFLYISIAVFEQLITKYKFVHLARSSMATAAMLLCVISLSSCQTSSNDKKGNTIKLTLDWLPNPNHIPLYAGINKGFFKEEGILLELQPLHDLGGISYLSTGKTDLIIYYMPSTIRAIEKGHPIKPIAVLIDQPLDGLIYRKEIEYTSFQDLSDKTFGFCGNGVSRLISNYLFKENKIRPKELRNVNFDLVSTLGNQQVDVIIGAFFNIEREQLYAWGIETGYSSFTSLGLPTYYELIVLANENSPQAQPEFIDRFQRAMHRSIQFSKQHPQEAFNLYAKANPDKSQRTLEWENRAWKVTLPLLAKNQTIDPVVWQTFSDWLNKVISSQ